MTAQDIFEPFWIHIWCTCVSRLLLFVPLLELPRFTWTGALFTVFWAAVMEVKNSGRRRKNPSRKSRWAGWRDQKRAWENTQPPICATYVLFVQLSFVFPFQVRRRLRRTDVLILDEISMLSGDFLDRASELLSHVRKQEDPFGGLQVVLCGDFLQLPPVKAETLAFQASVWSKSLVSKIELFRWGCFASDSVW